MKSSFSLFHAVLACAGALLLVPAAHARNESRLRPVADALGAKQSALSREALGNLQFRFGSASADGSELLPGTAEAQGEASIISDPRARVHLTDAEACQKAFEDAIAKLAVQTRRVGATAVVGIVSSFKGARVDDAVSYDCHSGSSASYVTLQASLARSVLPLSNRTLAPATGFAPLDDVRAVPVSDAGRERYAHFLTLPKPRAFVVYEDGGWRFYAEDPEAMTKSLDYCARQGRRCWLYAVDDRVVWSADAARRIGSSSQLESAGDHQ